MLKGLSLISLGIGIIMLLSDLWWLYCEVANQPVAPSTYSLFDAKSDNWPLSLCCHFRVLFSHCSFGACPQRPIILWIGIELFGYLPFWQQMWPKSPTFDLRPLKWSQPCRILYLRYILICLHNATLWWDYPRTDLHEGKAGNHISDLHWKIVGCWSEAIYSF